MRFLKILQDFRYRITELVKTFKRRKTRPNINTKVERPLPINDKSDPVANTTYAHTNSTEENPPSSNIHIEPSSQTTEITKDGSISEAINDDITLEPVEEPSVYTEEINDVVNSVSQHEVSGTEYETSKTDGAENINGIETEPMLDTPMEPTPLIPFSKYLHQIDSGAEPNVENIEEANVNNDPVVENIGPLNTAPTPTKESQTEDEVPPLTDPITDDTIEQSDPINEKPFTHSDDHVPNSTAENEDPIIKFSSENTNERLYNKSIPSTIIRTATDQNANSSNGVSAYYKKYILHRQYYAELTDAEVNNFIEALENKKFDEYLSLDPNDLEKYLFSTLFRVSLIGELPISEIFFNRLSEYIRSHGYQDQTNPQKKVPPAIFMISMVFCARYSKDGLRNFWDPYAKLVWKEQEATQNFQNKCREHFKNCRIDLERSTGLKFDYINEGGVVRPVYQHAIIPYYLQDDIADWIIRNYDFLIGHNAQEIRLLLKGSSSLDYMPRRLRSFISGSDTAETAAILLDKMGDALKIFVETGEEDDVITFLNSSIELSLWQMIYKGLMSTLMAGDRAKRSRPRLDWTWNMNSDELGLRVAGLRSSPEQKPDGLIWLTDPTKELLNNTLVQVSPWGSKSEGWEVDPEILIPEDTLKGSVLLLSEECNLNNTLSEESENIIYGQEIPPLTNELLLFKRKGNSDLAYNQNKINCDGEWLIISRATISIKEPNGKPVAPNQKYVPQILALAGYKYASLYSVKLPILLNDQLLENTETNEIEATLAGNQKFSNLSADVPLIFSNNKLQLNLDTKFNDDRMSKINFTIYHKGKTIDPVKLSELKQKNILEIVNGQTRIDLHNWILEPGVYVLNMLQNLKPILPEPIEFAWLPDEIDITEPEQNKVYSPVDPFIQHFYGIDRSDLQPPQENIHEIIETKDLIELTWGKLVHPIIRFRIMFQGEPIQFCWDIDRVDAWLIGADDPDAIVEDQFSGLSIQYVGNRNQFASVLIKGSPNKWNFKLPASGELLETFKKSALGDMLKEKSGSSLDVMAQMRGFEWKLFSVIAENRISIESARYSDGKLIVELGGKLPQQANFTIYAKQVGGGVLDRIEKPDTLWVGEKRFSHPLSHGNYTIEIHKDKTSFLSSQPFEVAQNLNLDGISLLFDDELRLRNAKSSNKLVQMIQQQFEKIHDPAFWTVNEENYDGIVNLLPAWAVVSNHIRLSSEYFKIIQVVPERAALKGKAGIGYADIKTDGKWIRVAVYWRPNKIAGGSLAWMGIPVEPPKIYCEADPYYLWPVYQCKDCGTFLGSRSGTAFKLPPSVHVVHDHGSGRPIEQQFIDTVYKEPVKVTPMPYLVNSIDYVYSPEDVISKTFLNGLVLGTSTPKNGELSTPVNFYKADDFNYAVSELFQNSNTNNAIALHQMASTLKASIAMIKLNKQNFSPFSAFYRLIRSVDDRKPELKIVAAVIGLGMLTRLRTNNLKYYHQITADTGLTDKKIIDFITLCSTTCPKLLTWSVTWAEIFLNHTAS